MIKNKLMKNIKEIVKVLKEFKEVKAISLTGGIISGYFDKYSDLDIYCLVTKLPDIKKRKKWKQYTIYQ